MHRVSEIGSGFRANIDYVFRISISTDTIDSDGQISFVGTKNCFNWSRLACGERPRVYAVSLWCIREIVCLQTSTFINSVCDMVALN